MAQLLEPTIRYAREGFPVTEEIARLFELGPLDQVAPEVVECRRQLGVIRALLPKPWDPDDLKKTLREALQP